MSLIERVARALMEVDFGTMGDEEQERWMARPLGDEFRRQARAAIAAMPELEAMQAEMERLRKSLEFYANPEIYKPHPHGPAFDNRDLSFKARASLSQVE